MEKNNTGFVEYAKAQLGRPYWFGTFGQIGNAKLWAEKAKQYSRYYSKARKDTMKARGDEGQKVHDCAGLFKGYLMSKGVNMPAIYDQKYDISADDLYAQATEKGPISTIPDIPGLGLHKKGHFGVYIGGGREIEARGFDYGVLEDDVTAAGFTEWFKLPFIEYVGSQEPAHSDNSADNAPITPEAGENEYIVVPGDTLTKIAERWGTSVKAIAELNGINNPDLIMAGQKLKRPAALPVEETWLGIVNTVKDPLRVRGGRGTNFPVIKKLPKGSLAELTGEAVDGWYKMADGSGWVSANFISR